MMKLNSKSVLTVSSLKLSAGSSKLTAVADSLCILLSLNCRLFPYFFVRHENPHFYN